MKQTNSKTAAFDLDDLERELKQASAPRKAQADDPLAELARIIGQDSPSARPAAARGAPSLDDILAAPPQPVAGPMPTATPRIEPLFPETIDDGRQPASIGPGLAAAAAAATPPPAKALDPLEALLAQDLGLRSGLDEMPAAVQPQHEERHPLSETVPALEEPEALTRIDDGEGQDVGSVAAAPGLRESVADATGRATAPDEFSAKAPNADKFDDMLAEFEAAMRDVATDAVAPPKVAAPPAAPLSDIVVPPPPPPTAEPPARPAIESFAAAGAAAATAGALAAARPRRGMMLAGGVIAVAVIGLGGLAVFGGSGSRAPGGGSAPVIAAKPGVTKERPANPGGVEVPNQDKEILQPRTAQAPEAARVAPREEQPVDLTQAQRQAAATSGQIRQIPGVGIVAPVTTTPPPGQPAPQASEPTPRPVASVPITIAGQPAPSLPSAAPLPPVSAPQAASVPALPPVAAPQPAPSVRPAPAAPAAAPSGQAGQAAQGQPPSEPRRVRSVPIRTDNGEAAPARGQAQPRIVAAAPPAAATPPAATDPNAPLRITPPTRTGAPSAAQPATAAAPRAAAPAGAQQGTVPSSVPSLDNDPPAAPTRTASTGSGFAVQLAAEGSEDAARARFERMRSQYGSVLGGSAPSIRSAEVNGRSVYRVRVGNMSREEATSMCERLKASGGSCFVARN